MDFQSIALPAEIQHRFPNGNAKIDKFSEVQKFFATFQESSLGAGGFYVHTTTSTQTGRWSEAFKACSLVTTSPPVTVTRAEERSRKI